MTHAVNFGHLSKYRSELMGVFCLWVMCFHSELIVTWPKALNPLRLIVIRGNAGVDAFLILSGISLYFAYTKMTATMPRLGHRLGQFYWRRFVRLFLPYLLICGPYFAWVAWVRTNKGTVRFLADFSQLSLPLKGEHAAWYVPALALFYLLYPLVFRLQQHPMKLRGKSISRGSVTLLLYFAAVVICWALMKFSPVFYKNAEIVLTRLPVFILGCGLGKWVKEQKPLPTYAVTGAGVFLLIYIFIYGSAVSKTTIWMRLSYAPFAMAALLVFAWVFWKLDHCTRIRKFFAFFGDRSLELYLSHVMIKKTWRFYFEDKMWDKWGVLPYLCILLIAVAVSAVLHPLIKWIAKKLLSIGAPKPAAER